MSWELLPSTSTVIDGEVTVRRSPQSISALKDGKGFVLNAFAVQGEEGFTLKFWLKGVDESFAQQFKRELHKGRTLMLENEVIVLEEREGQTYRTVHLNYTPPKEDAPSEEPAPAVEDSDVLSHPSLPI